MASGIPGTGIYGQIRRIADSLRANRQQLANAPLSSRERNRLTRWVEDQQTELKELRAKVRAKKKKQ